MTRTLTRDDLFRASRIIGCEEAALKAVIEVECQGRGFDDAGRPTVLFEPHIFERELNRLGHSDDDDVVIRAREAGIASPRWNRKLYPAGADARWRQIEMAMEIHQEAALRSASYGLGQVCGFNHRAAGYDTATEMVEAMALSEGHQLMAMVGFIVTNRLDDEIRRRRWTDFARKYNGPAYHKNRYDTKLERAYERHARDPEAFWRERPNYGYAPADADAGLVDEGVVAPPDHKDGQDNERWFSGWI